MASPFLTSLPWSRGQVPIVYEDNDIIVLNKPVGLLTVPIPKSAAENLFSILREYVRGRGKIALTVHRIDRYTSGLVVFAKHKTSRHQLVHQFLSHTPVRVYHCLVRGTVVKPEGVLKHHMKQVIESFKNVPTSKDDPEGAEARLQYKVLEQWEKSALVEVHLDTGFKNQIRAQFAILGNPLVGDIQYGKKTDNLLMNRQALHAYQLTIIHPSKKTPITFKADYPADFEDAMHLLKMGLSSDSVLPVDPSKPAKKSYKKAPAAGETSGATEVSPKRTFRTSSDSPRPFNPDKSPRRTFKPASGKPEGEKTGIRDKRSYRKSPDVRPPRKDGDLPSRLD